MRIRKLVMRAQPPTLTTEKEDFKAIIDSCRAMRSSQSTRLGSTLFSTWRALEVELPEEPHTAWPGREEPVLVVPQDPYMYIYIYI